MVNPLPIDSLDGWRSLCPALGIEAGRVGTRFVAGDPGDLIDQLRVEGYVHVPGMLPETTVAPLRECIALLDRSGIPPPFAFVYDEFWLAYQGVADVIAAALGADYLMLPDFWAWHVRACDQGAGWGPHRDRVQPTLDDDNSPHALTVWLPLSDATPLNGCMYVLPAHLDERFRSRVFDGPDNNRVADPQSIRAVPSTAGSLLAWNQALLHWGGRASRLAGGPRISVAMEFQRGDRPAFNRPLLDPSRLPTFRERLGLIGKQVLQYRHMIPLAPDLERAAAELAERFMPAVVAASPGRS